MEYSYPAEVPRPRTHDDALRARLLDRAAQLVAEHGPDQLGLRGLAADVDTSTTAVYALFGGKTELLAALAELAAERFAERLTPTDDLVALAMTYREAALSAPRLYALMRRPGLDVLRAAAGEDLGVALWATVHGLVALDRPAAECERAVRALLAGWPG